MRRIASIAFAAFTALATLAAAPVAAQEGLSPAQRQAVDDRIRAYILENPELLLEAFELLEQRRQQAQGGADADLIAAAAEALFDDGFSHVFGNPDGDVVIVEFSDYRCGYCKRAHPEVKRLLETDENVALVMKEFPILGPDSITAARAAMAALEEAPALYPAFHDAMMEHRGQLDEAAVFRIAAETGLDPESLRLAMAAPEIDARIRSTYALARSLRIEGTPAFVIGEQILRGMAPYATMAEMVAQARAGQD